MFEYDHVCVILCCFPLKNTNTKGPVSSIVYCKLLFPLAEFVIIIRSIYILVAVRHWHYLSRIVLFERITKLHVPCNE